MEAPHSCGAGDCAAIEKREASPNEAPFAPPQECGGSLKEALEAGLLTRFVTFNHARASEKKRDLTRWLRPDYQNPGKSGATKDGRRPPLSVHLPAPSRQNGRHLLFRHPRHLRQTIEMPIRGDE